MDRFAEPRVLTCRAFEGLCNRLNAIASALATSRPVLQSTNNRSSKSPLIWEWVFPTITASSWQVIWIARLKRFWEYARTYVRSLVAPWELSPILPVARWWIRCVASVFQRILRLTMAITATMVTTTCTRCEPFRNSSWKTVRNSSSPEQIDWGKRASRATADFLPRRRSHLHPHPQRLQQNHQDSP